MMPEHEMDQWRESSSMFEIRFTRHGLVPITDAIDLMILREIDQVEDSSVSFSTLRKRLQHCPQSTLFYHLGQLVEERVIDKIDRDDEPAYTSISGILMSSKIRIPLNIDNKIARVVSLLDNKDNYLQRMSELTFIEWSSMGFNTSLLSYQFGILVANMFKDELKGDTDEEIMMRLGVFTKDKGLPRVLPYSFSPLVILVESDGFVDNDACKTNDMMAGLVLRTLEMNSFSRYRLSSSKRLQEVQMVRMRFDPASDELKTDNTASMFDVDADADVWFAILKKNDSIIAVPNNEQIKILNRLRNGPMCIQELVDWTGKPRSSVTRNVEQLISKGLLSRLESGTGGQYFELNSKFMLLRNRTSDFSQLRESIYRMFENKRGIYDILFYYMHCLFIDMGLDSATQWGYTGEAFGETVYYSFGVNSMDTTLEFLKNCMLLENADFEIEDIFPLTIRFTSDREEGTSHGINHFYAMAIRQILEMKTGERVYCVSTTELDGTIVKDVVEYRYSRISLKPACE